MDEDRNVKPIIVKEANVVLSQRHVHNTDCGVGGGKETVHFKSILRD